MRCPIESYVYYQYLHYRTGVGIAVGNVKDPPVSQEGLLHCLFKWGSPGLVDYEFSEHGEVMSWEGTNELIGAWGRSGENHLA